MGTGRTRFLFKVRVDFRESAVKKATPEKPGLKVRRESKAKPEHRGRRVCRENRGLRESKVPRAKSGRRDLRGCKVNAAKPERRSGLTHPDRGKIFLNMTMRLRTSASSIRTPGVFT